MKFRVPVEFRVAHVGASQNDDDKGGIFRAADVSRFDQIVDWLYKNDSKTYEQLCLPRHDDFIDLNDGRDFLQEDKTYDIVILHFVYHARFGDRFRETSEGLFVQSPLHSINNWRGRLVRTGAKYIFADGAYSEISPETLSQLSGYEGPEILKRGHEIGVYTANV